MSTTPERQPPIDVADFDARLAEHASLTGIPLDFPRFMICAQTAGGLLPPGTALGGDAANPSRFSGPPTPPKLPTVAWINEPQEALIQNV
ncbi:MAG: hypothetical protein M0Z34_02580 [Nitrospiraceae bacterium]|nr:hypothetical protein [Nitrospiraceae bacterium]MDA8209823.1 hypothetical protein [Actinomycetota bacterium]